YAIRTNSASPNLLNGVADTVSHVGRSMFIAGIRGLRHKNSQISRRDRLLCQLQRGRTTLCLVETACGEHIPLTLWASIEVQCARASPIFHLVCRGVRTCPHDSESVHRLFAV